MDLDTDDAIDDEAPEEPEQAEAETQAADTPKTPPSAEPAAEPAKPPRTETRFPLAFDVNGNPLKVPPQAVAWRVRRGGGKRGRPRNVFDTTTGRQLEIALGASIEDLANTNVPADRYLLYPVDEHGTIVPGIVAVTEVTESDDTDDDGDRVTSLALAGKDPVTTAVAALERAISIFERFGNNQHDVIKAAMENHSRSLASAVSGYAPVRPVMPPPLPPLQPMYIEQPVPVAPPAPPQQDGLTMLASVLTKPETIGQIMMAAQHVYSMFKSATAANAGAPGGVPGAAP